MMMNSNHATYVIVQHNYGIGHLIRASQLAEIARQYGRTFLVSGGPRVTVELRVPGVECVQLPELQRVTLNDVELCSTVSRYSLDTVHAQRLAQLLQLFSTSPPRLLISEYFPFSPRRMEDLLIPALDEVRRRWPECRVVSSIRDVPVSDHEVVCAPRVRQLLRNYFDLVLSHADPRLVSYADVPEYADIDEVPILHTGILVRPAGTNTLSSGEVGAARVLVTTGGGRDGRRLLCLAAHALMRMGNVLGTLVAGPRMPSADIEACQELVARAAHLTFYSQIDELHRRLPSFDLILSQAGYNTTSEALAVGLPMLLFPRARSLEQNLRARALERAGAAVICSLDSSPRELAVAIENAIVELPAAAGVHFDLSGDSYTERALASLLA